MRSITRLSVLAALATVPFVATATPASASLIATMPTIYTLATQPGGACAGTVRPRVEVFGPTENPYVGAKVHMAADLYGIGRCATIGAVSWRNLDTGDRSTHAIWLQGGATTTADVFAPPGRIELTVSISEAHYPDTSSTQFTMSSRRPGMR